MLKLSNLESIGKPVYKFHNLHSVDFDGVDDFIQLDEPISYTQHTISTWVKASDTSSSKIIFDSRDSSEDGIRIRTNSDEAILYQINNSSITSSTTHTAEWVHIVGTYDGTTQKLYINGSLNQSTTTSQTISTTTNAKIGTRNFSTSAVQFAGKIDELAIFDRALTADEVTAIFRIKYGANLVQNGNFDELGSELITNGDFVLDSNWTLSSGITRNAGGYLDFSGEQGSGTAKNTPNITFVQGKTYKVVYEIFNYSSGNIKFRLQGGTNTIGSSQSGNGVKTEYVICQDSSNNNFQFFNSSSFIGSVDNVSVKQVDPNNRWNNIDDQFSFVDNGGKLSGTDSGQARLYAQNSSITSAGKIYKVSYTVVENNGTSLQHYDGNSYEAITSTVGDHSFIYTREGSNNNFILRNPSGASASIILTNIMLEEQKYVATNLKLKSNLFNPFTGSTLNLKNYYRFGDGILDTHPLICDMVEPSLGSELVTQPLNLSSNFQNNGGGIIVDNDTFTTAGGSLDGISSNSSFLVTGKTYKLIIAGNTTSSGFTIGNQVLSGNEYATGFGTHYFVASGDRLWIRQQTAGTTNITSFSIKQVNGVPGFMTNMTEADITNDVPS